MSEQEQMPRVLYVQVEDIDGVELWPDYQEEMTWADEPVNKSDVKYIRADVVATQAAEIERLKRNGRALLGGCGMDGCKMPKFAEAIGADAALEGENDE